MPSAQAANLVKIHFVLGVFSLDVCMCTMCMPGACRSQKRALDPLGLELQTVINYWGPNLSPLQEQLKFPQYIIKNNDHVWFMSQDI